MTYPEAQTLLLRIDIEHRDPGTIATLRRSASHGWVIALTDVFTGESTLIHSPEAWALTAAQQPDLASHR